MNQEVQSIPFAIQPSSLASHLAAGVEAARGFGSGVELKPTAFPASPQRTHRLAGPSLLLLLGLLLCASPEGPAHATRGPVAMAMVC